MSDQDRHERADGAGSQKRWPGSRALDAVSDVVGRLVLRPDATDRAHDGTRTPMSDDEIREAFRLASLTVTPAPLGRLSRTAEATAPDDQVGARRPDGLSDVPGGSSPQDTPWPDGDMNGTAVNGATLPPTTTRDRPPGSPRAAVASTARPASTGPEVPPVSAWAPSPAEPQSAGASRTPAIGSEPAAARPVGPHRDPDAPDQVELPGNLGFAVEDFFGGLVRRVERRP